MTDTFTYRGVEYPYVPHDSELAVVVPIMQTAIADATGEAAEVGTALGRRPRFRWQNLTLDSTSGDYALLVSATGIQHAEHDPADIVANLRARLASGGRLLLAAPLGFNNDLDRFLNPAACGADHVGYLAIQGDEWVEVDYRQARQYPYRKPSRGARAVAIAEWRAAEAVADDSEEDDGE